MKILKSIFASFVLLALTTAFATKSHAQTTKYYEYTGTGGFTIAEDAKTDLTTAGNWTERTSLTLPDCIGSNDICYFQVDYTLPANTTAPTKQQILDKLATKYNDATAHGHFFNYDSGHTFTVSITIDGHTFDLVFTIVERAS